jgi:peptide/nickel transport system permease protein
VKSMPATPPPAASASASPLAGGRRPNPRIAQMKRTFYFLRHNVLAMIGLAILIFFGAVAAYSTFDPAPSDHLQNYCGTYVPGGGGSGNISGACVQVCTYPSNGPVQPNCYPVPATQPSLVGPTINWAGLSGGPLPLGSLSVVASGNQFYSVYDGLVKGAPWSLGISVGIVGAGALVGLLLGSVAGYKGGLIDESLMRMTDVFLSIPGLFLVLIVLAVLGGVFQTLTGRVVLLMVAFIVTWWPIYTRIVRGQVLVTREQKYVEASKASGASTSRILRKHIIPNSLYPVFVQMSLDVGTVPLLIGAVVFLGYIIWPTQYFPEWGTLAAQSTVILESQIVQCGVLSGVTQCLFPWWQVLFPGATVFLFAIAVSFLSDGLRDALDPRLRR